MKPFEIRKVDIDEKRGRIAYLIGCGDYEFKVSLFGDPATLDYPQNIYYTNALVGNLNDCVERIAPFSPREMFDGMGPDVEDFRPGQLEAAWFIQALAEDFLGNIYVDAPTGSGKSIIALTIAHLDRLLLPGNGTIAIVTADHQLQEQYAVVDAVGSVTGRANWVCAADPSVNADRAACTTSIHHRDCGEYRMGACPYYLQKEQALDMPVVVSNYHYLLKLQYNHHFSRFICDEGHAAEQIYREAEDITVPLPRESTRERTQRMVRTGRHYPLLDDNKGWQKLLARAAQEADAAVYRAMHQAEELQVALPEGTDWRDDLAIIGLQQEARRQDALRNLYYRATRIVDTRLNHKELRGDQLRVSPLVGDMTLMGGAAIYLSATLIDPSITDKRFCYYVELPSTFPAKQRPVVALNAVKLSKDATPADYRKLAATVDGLLLKHSAEKGIIHTVSYELANKIKSLSAYPGLLITHGPGGRDAAVEEYRQAPPGRVLLSPAIAAGVDLPYDQCRWQAIAKLPFPNVGDKLMAARVKAIPGVSELDTARTIVQMAGRGMRAPDDTCTTYILDSNWRWFWRANHALFPAWFREAVQ